MQDFGPKFQEILVQKQVVTIRPSKKSYVKARYMESRTSCMSKKIDAFFLLVQNFRKFRGWNLDEKNVYGTSSINVYIVAFFGPKFPEILGSVQ